MGGLIVLDNGKKKLAGGIVIADGETGAPAFVSPSGNQEVAELIRLIGGNFESGTLLPHIWETGISGSGTISAINGEAVFNTGIVADSSSSFQTTNRARFVTATFNKAHLAIQTPNEANTDVIRRWGMFDPVTPILLGDGLYFENNSGALSVNRLRGGIVTETVASASFSNVLNNPVVIDDEVHVYEIVYNAGSAFFFQDRKLLHVMKYLQSVGYNTTHLRAGAHLENINGNIVDNQLKSRGFSCSRIGSSSAIPNQFRVIAATSGVIKASAGELKRVVITNIGAGGATLDLFDSTDSVTNPILSMDLTKALASIELGFEFSNGLSYVSSGNNFEVSVIYD